MPPVALITGGARRIGAAITREFHAQGYDVAIHYRRSRSEAESLGKTLNDIRPRSAACFQADLTRMDDIRRMASVVTHQWQRLDTIVNNASSFYPTPFKSVNEAQWNDLLDGNLKGPFFLAQALAGELRNSRGTIVNIVDINARYPLRNFSVYCIAKAGLAMLTKSLALELAPEVRVNGIAPGAILWPDEDAQMPMEAREAMLSRIPLHHLGQPEDIARLAVFLAATPGYLTGQVIAVDGGLSLSGKLD